MSRFLAILFSGWGSPKCPLPTGDKYWIEKRLGWLADCFGMERLLTGPLALPDESFWDVDFAGTEADARRILNLLCAHLKIPAAGLSLEVVEDAQLPDAAGHYDRSGAPVIRIRRSLLTEILPLTTVLAHELMHEILLGGGHLTGVENDHERTTDLALVYFGLGLFAANSTIRFEATHTGNWESWSMSRIGYLPSQLFGYALALYALWREEDLPDWISHLRPDASETLLAARYYLLSTDDCLFHPKRRRDKYATANPSTWLHTLKTAGPTARFGALREIAEHQPQDRNVLAAVVATFRDRDVDLAAEAIRTYVALGQADEAGTAELCRLLEHSPPTVRLTAIDAIGKLRLGTAEVVDELCRAVRDTDREPARAAAGALGCFGRDAERALRPLLQLHKRALIDVDELTSTWTISAICQIANDPRQALVDFYEEQDGELLSSAMESLTHYLRVSR